MQIMENGSGDWKHIANENIIIWPFLYASSTEEMYENEETMKRC